MINNFDKILNSLENMSKASPPPNFYNGILKKLYNPSKNIWERWSAFIARPAVLAAGFVLIVMLNLFSIIVAGGQQTQQQVEMTADNYDPLTSGSTFAYLDFETNTP